MPLDTLSSDYEKAMCSQKDSDLILSCHGTEFKVHKATVCAQSSVLAAACGGSFKEAISNVIAVDKFDPDTVKRMILFMYTHTYYDGLREESDCVSCLEIDSQQEIQPPDQPKPHPAPQTDIPTAPEIVDPTRASTLESLLSSIKMNAIADYYDIPELRRCANARLQNILNMSWSPHAFLIAVQESFDSTGDKELHNILSVAMAAHAEELIGLAKNIAPPDLISDFALSVIRNMVAAKRDMETELVQRVQDLESQLRQAEDSIESQKRVARHEKLAREITRARTERVEKNITTFQRMI